MSTNLALASIKVSGGTTSRTLGHHLLTPGFNVVDFGAAGNYNPTADTGTDDTAAIQAAIDAAQDTGESSHVIIPGGGGRAYKITDTLTAVSSISILGLGKLSPRIMWRGAAGGTMLELGSGVSNIASHIANISFVGYRNDSNIASGWAGCAIDHLSGVDAGHRFDNVSVANINGNAVKFIQVTNSCWDGGRFDRCTGYPLYFDLSDYNAVFQLMNCTWDNWDDAMGAPYNNGFMFLDGEASTGTNAQIFISGFHPEINGTINATYAAGVNPTDKSGIIRMGINPSTNNIQHIIDCESIPLAFTSGVPSCSFFQCTSVSGTLAQHMARVSVRLRGGRNVTKQGGAVDAATNTVKILANVPTAFECQYPTVINCDEFARSAGPVGAEVPFRDVWAPHQTDKISRVYDDLFDPVFGEIKCITDSNTNTQGANVTSGGGGNKVLIWYNGTHWKVIGIDG